MASPRTWRLLLLAVLVVSAVVRLVFFLEFRDTDLSVVPLLDSETYHHWAVRLAAGDPGWHETYWMGPLYPHWLALVYLVFGVSMHAAEALQLVLTLLNVWLVHRVALRLLTAAGRGEAAPAVALLAATLYAFYGPPVFYAGFLLMAVLTTTMFLLVAWQAVRAVERPTPWQWLLLGLVTGLAGLARGNILLMLFTLPLLLLVPADLRVATRGRRLRPVLLFAAGLLAMVVPVTVRNVIVAQDLVLLTTNAGVNLLIGQQASGGGIFKPVIGAPQVEHDPSMEMALEWEMGRDVKGSEVSRILTRRAWETFRDDLAHMPAHYLRKIWRFWSGYELPQIASFEFWQGRFLGLRLLPVPYLLLSALGLAGFIFLPSRARWILGLLVGTYFLSLLPFFPTARYRQPIAPLLAISMATWLVAMTGLRLGWPRALDRRRLLRHLGLAAALILVLWPSWTALDPAEVVWQVRMHEASRAAQLGKVRVALAKVREAEEARPGLAETHFRLALYLQEAGALPEAESALRLALSRSPSNRMLIYRLGRIQEARGQLDAALATFARAAEISPDWAYPWLRTGLVLQRQGRRVEALAAMERAHARAPGNRRVRANLGALQAENGRLDESRRTLHALTRDYPVYVNGWFNLALVEMQAGEREAALRALDRAAGLRNLTAAERDQVARLRAAFGAGGPS